MRRTVTLCFVLLLGMVATATADEQQAQQVEQFKQMLDQLDEKDSTGAAEVDRRMARKWLKEAEVLVANGDDKAAKRRLTRIEASLDLIRAEVNAALIRQRAEQQEAAAHNSPETKAQLEADVQKLRDQKQELMREKKKLQRELRNLQR